MLCLLKLAKTLLPLMIPIFKLVDKYFASQFQQYISQSHLYGKFFGKRLEEVTGKGV